MVDRPQNPENNPEEEISNLLDIEQRNQLSEAEKKDEIRKIVKNPLLFSLRDIDFLEDNRQLIESDNTLNSEFRYNFRRVTEYLISISVVDFQVLPPKVLYTLAGSTLSDKYLSSEVYHSMMALVDKDIQTVEELTGKETNMWSMSETAQVLSLYNIFKKKKNQKAKKKMNEFFEKLVEKLVERVIKINEKSERLGLPLSSAEKLIIWEIERNVPQNFEISGDARQVFDRVNQQSSQELIDNILNQKIKNDPNLVLLWDTLESLSTNGNITLNDTQKEKIRKFVLRTNVAQFLSAVKRFPGSVWLPSHLEAFDLLSKTQFKNILTADGDDFINQIQLEKDPKDEQERIELQEQLSELRKKIRNIENKNIDEILEIPNLDTFIKEEYESAEEEMDAFVQQTFSVTDDANENVKITEFIETIKGIFVQDTYPMAKREFGPLITEFQDTNTTNRNRYDIFKQIHDKLKERAKNGFHSDQNQDNQDPDISNENAQKIQNKLSIIKNTGLLGKWEQQNQNIDAAIERLKTDAKQEETEEQEVLKEEQNELLKKIKEQQKSEKDKSDIFKLYKNPTQQQEQIQNDYWEKLEQRISKHTLHAADFQVIFDQSENEDFSENQNTDEKSQILEFREKFKALLESPQTVVNFSSTENSESIESVIRNIDLSKPNLDALNPWLRKIDQQIGVSYFRKQLQEELSQFPSPQIKESILEGAIAYFRDDIERKIENALQVQNVAQNQDEFLAQKQFFLNQIRRHSNIYKASDVNEVDRAYHNYFDTKDQNDIKTFTESNLLKGVVEDIPEEDDKNQILGAYQFGTNCLKYGYQREESDIVFPGTEKIQEAKIQLTPFQTDMKDFSDTFYKKVNCLQKYLSEMERRENTNEKQVPLAINDLIQYWEQEGRSRMKHKIDEFQDLCKNQIFVDHTGQALYPEFVQKYLEGVSKPIQSIEKSITHLKEAKKTAKKLSSKDLQFIHLTSGMKSFEHLTNFDGGVMNKMKSEMEGRLFGEEKQGDFPTQESFTKTIVELKSLEVFEDRKKAQENFDVKRKHYKGKFGTFQNNLDKFRSRIESDAKNLADESFESKYGMRKAESENLIEHFLSFNKDFKTHFRKFDRDDYFENWWKKFKNSDESTFAAIQEFQDFESLSETVDAIDSQSQELGKWLEEYEVYNEAQRKNQWFNRFKWKPISLYSIYHMIKKNIELVENRWQRKQDRMAYDLGVNLMGENTPWGLEFQRLSEESEDAKINEWKTAYGDYATYQLEEKLYASSDPDEVRACIDLMNENGDLKWENPQLWLAFMRLQDNVIFDLTGDLKKDPETIKEKVRDACGLIWSKKVFDDWNTSIADKISSSVTKYNKDYTDLASKTIDGMGARQHTLSKMLADWHRGDYEYVNAAKYNAFIVKAIEQGEMNGSPDPRWYYIIKGITTKNPQGQPLLSPTIFNQFNDQFKGQIPHLDFFVDGSSCKKDGKIVPEGFGEAREWKYQDFEAWGNFLGDFGGTFNTNSQEAKENLTKFFHQYINQSKDARARVHRYQNKASQNFDRDDYYMAGSSWKLYEVLQTLSARSEGTEQSDRDGWRNYLNEFDTYMVNLKELLDNGDKEYGLEDMQWKNHRDGLLLEAGEIAKAHYGVTQVLSGNMASKAQTPTIFSKDQWDEKNEKGAYSPSAAKSKQNIDRFIGQLFLGTDKEEVVQKMIKKKNYLYGDNSSAIKRTMGQNDLEKDYTINNDITSDIASAETFGNVTKMEQALNAYLAGSNNVITLNSSATNNKNNYDDFLLTA